MSIQVQDNKEHYITSAPEAYDYWYTKTVRVLGTYGGKQVREITHNDPMRFRDFQIPRYGSGLYFCHPKDSDDGKYILSKLEEQE